MVEGKAHTALSDVVVLPPMQLGLPPLAVVSEEVVLHGASEMN